MPALNLSFCTVEKLGTEELASSVYQQEVQDAFMYEEVLESLMISLEHSSIGIPRETVEEKGHQIRGGERPLPK